MLQRRKAEIPAPDHAQDIYAMLLLHIRAPGFYRDCGVPDTLDGRFELLVLHAFLIMNRLVDAGGEAGQDFNQRLFDILFKDMDQTLRETGVGDMRIAKHMRRMMRGFNGRVQAYRDVLADPVKLAEALRRNLYGTFPGVTAEQVSLMCSYIQKNKMRLDSLPPGEIMAGSFAIVGIEPIQG